MTEDSTLLRGKKCLVVGGGGHGIGRAISAALVTKGGDLAIVDRDKDRAESAARELARPQQTVIPVVADVFKRSEVRRMVTEAEEQLTGIDVLVTVVGGMNAFGLPFVRLHEYTDDEVQRVLDGNLLYVLTVLREVIPRMISHQSGGSIICVGSIAGGPNGSATNAIYGASKAALSNLIKSVATEYGYAGIRANVVAPGAVVTPVVKQREGSDLSERLARIPLGRQGDPTDIADVVAFFASDLSRYVTGQTLAVDGGATANNSLSSRMPAVRKE
jgi:3-oxoacyl-[acyl-carrier protein] reductase